VEYKDVVKEFNTWFAKGNIKDVDGQLKTILRFTFEAGVRYGYDQVNIRNRYDTRSKS
jgi:hypothetical protein